MKKFNSQFLTLGVLFFALLTCVQSFAQEMKYSNMRDGNGITVNVAVDDFSFESLTYKGEEMQEINISGINLPNDAGMPNLPRVSRYIAVPQGAEAKITVRNISTETIENVNLAPALEIQAEVEEPAMDYKKNEKVYSTNAMYPAQMYELSEPTSVRGVDAVILGVTPFQYNPVTKQLVVVRSIDIDVEFIGGNNHYGEDRYRSRWFDPILQNIFLNYEALPKMDYSKLRDGEGCEYLIVIPNNDEWLPYAEAIRTWRTEQGISTQIMSLADMGCSTTAQIKTFMHNAYNNWDIPPVAVLMMADHGTDLTHYIPAESISHPYSGSCITDNQYADVTGDYLPEMAFARMVGSTVAEIAIISSKSLEYEQNPCMDAAYYNNPVTALGWQTERWFQLCSEVVGGYFRANDKEPVRINCIYSGTPGSSWSSNQNTTAVVNYFGPNGLNYIPATPTELGGWTGGTPAQIVTAMNTGAFIVQHRDHGLEDGWGEPAFRSSHVAQLTNVGKMSYVFSINCLTGKFDLGSKCFAENFILRQYNNENAGAVGILCPTEVSYSFVNDTYVWGVYDLFEPDFLPTFGPYAENSGNWMPCFANVAGKYFLAQSSWPYNSDDKQITYQMFTHHGDAFLRLYSEVPQDLTVNHLPTVIAGATSVSISCNEGALIALTVDGEIIAVADATGSYQDITIPVLIPTTEIKVVCTKQNYLRYTGTITVVPAEGPYVVCSEWVVNDESGDGILKYGESATIDMTAKNVGVETANNVVMTISSESEYITITDNTANFGTLEPDATNTVANAFAVTVSEDAPNNQNIPFSVVCTDGTDSWASNMSFKVYRPIMEYEDFIWPGSFVPGETLNIAVLYVNDGGAPVDAVIATLATANEYVTIASSEFTIGTINGGAEGLAMFSVTISEDAPSDVPIDFTTTASGDDGVITAEGSLTIANSCNVIFNLVDSYGDGWNGASLTVSFDDGSPSQSLTISSGNSATYTLEINSGTTVTVSFVSGSWNSECSFNIQYEDGTAIYASSGTPSAGVQCTFVCNCGGGAGGDDCDPVENLSVEVEDTTVTLTWDGAALGYFIERNGEQVGTTTNTYYQEVAGDYGTVEYSVIAFCENGATSDPTSISAEVVEPLFAPLTVTAVVEYNVVTVSWTAHEPQTMTTEGYNVYKNGTLLGTVSELFYVDNLVPNDEYTYCVEVVYNLGTSEQTCGDASVMVYYPPVNMQAIAEGSTVVLTWEAPDLTLTSEPTGYNIYNNDVLLATVAELTYTDAAMVNGANNYCVESVYGDAVSGQVCQAIEYYYPPVNLVLNAINNTVEITWDAPDPVVALPDAYSIYKNGTLLVDGITATSYVDEVPEGKSSTLIYGVTAVYAVNESLAVEGSVDYSGIGSGESDIMVYPNPVNSMLFIESEGSISARIYNAAGQLVEVKKGKDLIQVNTSNYATGIYSVDVITNERVTKTKFVVSR